jgi:hypothetical protein
MTEELSQILVFKQEAKDRANDMQKDRKKIGAANITYSLTWDNWIEDSDVTVSITVKPKEE